MMIRVCSFGNSSIDISFFSINTTKASRIARRKQCFSERIFGFGEVGNRERVKLVGDRLFLSSKRIGREDADPAYRTISRVHL